MRFSVFDRFEYWKRAQDSIAQGALTNSKHPSSHVFGVYPTHVTGGSLGKLFGVDGQVYKDYICGLGSNLFGYSHPGLVAELGNNLTRGFSHSLPCTDEVATAEKLKSMFYFVDKFKFLKSGSEACNASIRIARTYQGVRDGNENLLEVFAREVLKRFSLEMLKNEEEAKGLQGLCEGSALNSESQRNQALGTSEIHGIVEGEDNGEEIFSDQISKNNRKREKSDLLRSPQSSIPWDFEKTTLRDLWGYESSGSSRGLHQTIIRDLALSHASRDGAPKFLILCDGYHGIGDMFISLTDPHHGILNDLGILPLEGNEDLIDIAAAVIIEPVLTQANESRFEWLRGLAVRCQKAGCLLIFDEVINAFRFGNHSVAMHLNLYPDLIVLGKAIANGLPLAAVGGKAELMDGPYFISSTYAGETLSLASCRWTVDMLLNNPQYKIDNLWEQGTRFIARTNKMGMGKISIEGYPTRGVFKGEPLTKALFFQEACKAGFLFGPSFFYSFANRDFDFEFFTFFKDFMDKLNLGVLRLSGDMPTSPFAERVRKNG